jgi:hypothetical protein
MFDINNNNLTSQSINMITGVYSYMDFNADLDNVFYLPSILNENDLEKQYIEDKKKMERHICDIELINIKLLQNIRFLNKICCFVNIKHSNTTNFIMRNYRQIKQLLDNYVDIYNKNLNKINLMKQKINNINLNILYVNRCI